MMAPYQRLINVTKAIFLPSMMLLTQKRTIWHKFYIYSPHYLHYGWLTEGCYWKTIKPNFSSSGPGSSSTNLSPWVHKLVIIKLDPSWSARNLGTIIDNSLSMKNHINQIWVCKACFYHIHNIRRIAKFLSMECLQTLVVHAFVTSRIDYYNSLLYMGCPNIRFVSYNESRTLPQDLLRTLGRTTVSRHFSMRIKILITTFKSQSL